MPAVLWASISLASLRASSTGCTSELKARLKTPSTRPSIRLSRLRRTLISGLLLTIRRPRRPTNQARFHREQDAVTDGEPGPQGGGETDRGEAQGQGPLSARRLIRKAVE